MIKKKINIKLLLLVFIFMIISCFTIYSSMLYLPSYLGNLALRQLLWYLLGFIFIFIIYKIDIINYSLYLYIFNIILLLLLLIVGKPINGSKCWFIIPGIGSFQPSEFMKIFFIIINSKILSNWINNYSFKSEIKLLITIFSISILPIVLTFLEPDTGAVFIYLIIIFSMLFISPLRRRWFIFFIIFILITLLLFTYIYFFKQDLFTSIFGTDLFYRINRLLDWKNGTSMQLENSITAIGSSGIFGHGYYKTPIYFPESGTDFIFSVYASNFGLIGCLLFIISLLIFDLTLINTAIKTKHVINKYIIIGSLSMFLYQQFQNIGMTIGILPITGITLPFISYGGSSLLSYMIIIGIIFKIENDKNIN